MPVAAKRKDTPSLPPRSGQKDAAVAPAGYVSPDGKHPTVLSAQSLDDLAEKVQIGDTVYWWRAGVTSHDPLPGMVIRKDSGGSLTIHVFATDGDRIFSGVRHRDDSTRQAAHTQSVGCWAARS